MTHAAPIALGLQPGDVVAGKYRVERLLGTGGMGVVVAARHQQLGERVALKMLQPHLSGHPEAVARFVREARAAARIKNEHVARVSDVGQLADGSPYMVMEYLEGIDLATWLQQRGPMPAGQAVDAVMQACQAIAEAHALGIVHRDLKPANLFAVRRPDGRLAIKVLDFGISKITALTALDAPVRELTGTRAVVGSPFYMSPEQVQSARRVDARTDVWSLGVILFELLTGSRPFQATGFTQVALKVMAEPAPRVRSLRADVPAALDHVVARCLEKDRSRRFQTVRELAAALARHRTPRARPARDRSADLGRAVLAFGALALLASITFTTGVLLGRTPVAQRGATAAAAAMLRSAQWSAVYGSLAPDELGAPSYPALVEPGAPRAASTYAPEVATQPGSPRRPVAHAASAGAAP